MARNFLPRQDVQIADQSGRATTPYYVWMQSLDRALGSLDVDLAALLEQIEQLKPGQKLTIDGAMSVIVTNVDGTITISLDGDNDSPGGNWYYGTNEAGVRGFWPIADGVSGGYSITKAVDYGPYNYQGELDTPDELPYPVVVDDAYLINGDLWVGRDDGEPDDPGWDNLGPAPTTAVLSLINDEATPDPTHYYGTDAAGNKGWHPVSDAVEAATGELTKDVDGDGVTTFGLADVTPTPGGTLQRYGFDTKGRRVEEEAADTDDLAEGASNLYFTDERAQDAVGAVADDSGDVELHYETSPARRLWAVLSSAVQSALSAAVSALQPGDDVSQLTNDAGYLTDAPSDGDIYGRKNGAWEQITTSGGGTVTSVGLSVPTGFQVSGSPVTTSGTLTVTYDTGYQGYTSAEASKLSGIEAGATVGADWSVNLSNIPANIASWAGIPPADKADAAALANYLPLAGGTMAGHLIIGNAFDLRMDSTTPATRVIRWMTGGSNRWTLFANASAESGGNAGSDLVLQAYSDAGAPIGAVLTVSRATGIAAFSQRPTFGGSTPWDDANLTPVNATGNQTGLAGDKTWTGAHTFTQSPTAITFGAGGATVGGNASGVAVLGANSNNIYLRPNGAGSTAGQLSLTPAGVLTVGGARVWDAASLVVATGTATWNPASIPVNGSATTTVTIPGAVMGDIVMASFTNDLQGMTISAYISAPGTATVVLTNNTAAAINLASGTIKAMVIRA